jgi:four helix bundle protein
MMMLAPPIRPIFGATIGARPRVGKIRSFKDLIVWQRGMELSKACQELVRIAPKRATSGIASQLTRAADSVSALIAEGHGRPTRQDYLHFVGMARASVREVESHLLTLERARGLHGPTLNLALSLCDECGRMLTVLQRRLRET